MIDCNTIINDFKGYRVALRDEFARRKLQNPSYSVRAFARSLNLSNSSLAAALSGKRDLSKRNLLKLANKFSLPPSLTNQMLEEIGYLPSENAKGAEFLTLADDTFNMISNWYYLGILNLCQISSGQNDAKYFAQRLGISEIEAKNAIDRLVRLGFLSYETGSLTRSEKKLSTQRNVPSTAVRKYHRQNLEKAAASLEDTPVNLRDISSITFPADLSKYKMVTDLIMDFKRKVARVFETTDATEVYTLGIQLFPITRSKR